METKITYRVTIDSDFKNWRRFGLFLTIVGYDDKGERVCYVSSSGRESDGTITAQSQPCDNIEIFAYIIAETFPETTVIKDAPPFEARMRIFADEKLIEESLHEVNQWGGATISGYRVSAK